MDQEELRSSYLKHLKSAPSVRAAIVRAAKAGGGSVTLRFARLYDNPFLLYACWGYARTVGVTLVLPPEDRPSAK